jgi:carbonic anhydrase
MVTKRAFVRRAFWVPSLVLVVAGWGYAAAGAAEGDPGWGYNCAEGAPFVWGLGFPACNGDAQSPIAVSTTGAVRKPLPPLAPSYGPTDLEVVNDGHTVEAEVKAVGPKLEVGGETYELIRFHWHTPSEHWLDGERFPMELHMVHGGEHGSLVLGSLVREGRANEELEKIWAVLPREPGGHEEVDGFDVSKLLPGSLASYRYPGSLTTPGCDQGIQWVLLAEPVEMSAAQIATFQELFLGNGRFPVGNARPLQPRNGREVVTDAGGD